MIHIIAHRGASALEPENTLSAFERAIGMGATMLEVDVHLSRDGRLVVVHDADLSRTTDGQGQVSDLTLAQIRRFDAGLGEHVPTLWPPGHRAGARQGRVVRGTEGTPHLGTHNSSTPGPERPGSGRRGLVLSPAAPGGQVPSAGDPNLVAHPTGGSAPGLCRVGTAHRSQFCPPLLGESRAHSPQAAHPRAACLGQAKRAGPDSLERSAATRTAPISQAGRGRHLHRHTRRVVKHTLGGKGERHRVAPNDGMKRK